LIFGIGTPPIFRKRTKKAQIGCFRISWWRTFTICQILKGFLKLCSSEKSLSGIWLRIWCSIYRSRDKRGQEGMNLKKKKNFNSDFDAVFFNGFLIKIYHCAQQSDFGLLLRILIYRGPKEAKNCTLAKYLKFSFFIPFWWELFLWIHLGMSWRINIDGFCVALSVSELQGAKGGKIALSQSISNFYFYPNLTFLMYVE
jgi:hypothetical protein